MAILSLSANHHLSHKESLDCTAGSSEAPNVSPFMQICYHKVFEIKSWIPLTFLPLTLQISLFSIISCLKVPFATLKPLLLFSLLLKQATTAAWNEKQILIYAGVTLECKIWEAQGGVMFSPLLDTVTHLLSHFNWCTLSHQKFWAIDHYHTIAV